MRALDYQEVVGAAVQGNAARGVGAAGGMCQAAADLRSAVGAAAVGDLNDAAPAGSARAVFERDAVQREPVGGRAADGELVGGVKVTLYKYVGGVSGFIEVADLGQHDRIDGETQGVWLSAPA